MNIEDWKKKELEKMYINVFIMEEETYVKLQGEIKKQNIYIFIGLNLKGYKDIMGVYTPKEETTGYWIKKISSLKSRGVEEIFMVSMINNKWLKKVIKMVYPEVIYSPSLIEFYNKTYLYIARRDHRIIMREMGRIYRAEDIDTGRDIYNKLVEQYKNNKLLILIINKYIKEIFDMFKYGHQARIITCNTDGYNKMRCRIRVKMKQESTFDGIDDLKEYLYEILKVEEDKWHPSVRRWDKIINEIDCNLSEKILELI